MTTLRQKAEKQVAWHSARSKVTWGKRGQHPLGPNMYVQVFLRTFSFNVVEFLSPSITPDIISFLFQAAEKPSAKENLDLMIESGGYDRIEAWQLHEVRFPWLLCTLSRNTFVRKKNMAQNYKPCTKLMWLTKNSKVQQLLNQGPNPKG